jgi:hypothetical protein
MMRRNFEDLRETLAGNAPCLLRARACFMTGRIKQIFAGARLLYDAKEL